MSNCLRWSDHFLVKIETVDSHHIIQYDLINKLYNMISNKYTQVKSVADIIQSIIDNTQELFLMEEELLHKFDVPYLNIHKKEHQGYIVSLTGLKKKHFDKCFITSDDIAFTLTWMPQHIQKYDRFMATYINFSNFERQF